jgi:23S rRNA pseudouridine2605 synthase
MSLVRIDKLMVGRGLGSRSEAHKLIRQGRVRVSDQVVTHKDSKFTEDSVIHLDGVAIDPLPIALAWHKPTNIISTMRDPLGRPDLATCLPVQWQGYFHPVGRLDKETSGLLLFSRSGPLTQWLLHPRRALRRWYEATVEIPFESGIIESLAAGVETALGTFSADVERYDGDFIRLSVTEGKHRMVRRMLANSGHPVVTLHRVQYGPIKLADLSLDTVRPLSDLELDDLRAHGAPIR